MKKCLLFVLALVATSTCARADDLGDFFSRAFGGQSDAKQGRYQSGAAHDAYGYASDRSSFTALASWYGGGERLSRRTASGERFLAGGLTAAHRSLPLGTRLLVSHRGHSVVVRVNDRGPAAWTGRSLDLSRGAAAHLGLLQRGTGHIQVTVLGRG